MAEVIDITSKIKAVPNEEQESMIAKKKAAIAKLPKYRGEVQSKNTIRQLPDVEPGQIFWVEMDKKAYLVAEKDRHKMTIKALDETATISTGMTIFDMNKGLVSKEPLFDWDDEDAVEQLEKRIEEWFGSDVLNEFYLMYGRDIHYVTVLRRPMADGNFTSMAGCEILPTIKDLLDDIGELVSMDFNTSDGEPSIEIWIRTASSRAELLYLFPYDKGLVQM